VPNLVLEPWRDRVSAARRAGTQRASWSRTAWVQSPWEDSSWGSSRDCGTARNGCRCQRINCPRRLWRRHGASKGDATGVGDRQSPTCRGLRPLACPLCGRTAM